MAIFLAFWPDNSMSLFRLRGKWSDEDVFQALDSEGDPADAVLWTVESDDGEEHLAFSPPRPDGCLSVVGMNDTKLVPYSIAEWAQVRHRVLYGE